MKDEEFLVVPCAEISISGLLLELPLFIYFKISDVWFHSLFCSNAHQSWLSM